MKQDVGTTGLKEHDREIWSKDYKPALFQCRARWMGCTLHEITDPSHRVRAKPLSSRQENRTLFSSFPSSIRSELIHTRSQLGKVFICWRNIRFDYLMTLRGNNWKAMLRIRRIHKSTNDRWSSVIGHVCEGRGSTFGIRTRQVWNGERMDRGTRCRGEKEEEAEVKEKGVRFRDVTFLLRLEIILTWCNG